MLSENFSPAIGKSQHRNRAFIPGRNIFIRIENLDRLYIGPERVRAQMTTADSPLDGLPVDQLDHGADQLNRNTSEFPTLRW